MDYEQFNDTSFQDNIQLTNQIAYGNNYFTGITTVFDTLSNIISLVGIVVIMTMLNKAFFYRCCFNNTSIVLTCY